jgi:PAS domain S-box-containing protein
MSAVERVIEWIRSPIPGASDEAWAATTVFRIGVAYTFTALVVVGASLLFFADSLPRLVVGCGVLGLLGLAILLVRRGYTREASIVLVAACWSSLTLALAMNGSIRLAAHSGLVLAICSAGLLLGQRAAFAVALLSALVGPLAVGLGHAPLPDLDSPFAMFAFFGLQAAIFASAAALVSIAVNHAQGARARARRSEERFRALTDCAQDIILEFDRERRFVYANAKFLEVRGLRSFADLAHERLGLGIHPDDVERVRAEIGRVIDRGGSAHFSARVTRPDGGDATLDITADAIVDSQGAHRAVVVARDITAQRATENALRDSEERHRLLTEYAPDVIVEMKANGGIIWGNRAARLAHGAELSELRAGDFAAWTHPDDIEICKRAFEQAMLTGKAVRLVHRLRRQDGNYMWVSSSGAPYCTSQGEMRLVGQSRDLSDEMALQEQLRQAQKMEAIGRLAGGMAHDFNNVLTVIRGYAGLLETSEDVGSESLKAAREIAAAADRAAGLTRQLLALSRRQIAKTTVVDANEVVRALEPVLRRTLPERIEVEFLLDSGLPSVQAVQSQLDQILLNLALNARDAMPSGGKLRIETRAGADGASAHIVVTDTGTGMSEATRMRAFEPFFTTKPPGEGTGLGLSTTYGIVQQCGGVITLDSSLGNGTRVAIELPAAPANAIEREERPLSASISPAPCDASILLVEDDPSVRRLLTLLLHASGYRMYSASNAEEALRIADECGVMIDLLLTDYMMPGLSGVELGDLLRGRWPALRILLMTGHAEVPRSASGQLPAGAELLWKPFTREQLEQVLAREFAG